MEQILSIPLPTLLVLVQTLGLPGMIVAIWWSDHKQIHKLILTYQAETAKILSSYKADIAEIREMYVKNAALVRKYETLADGQATLMQDLIKLMTKITEKIDSNMFCPQVRREANKI